MRWFRSKRGAIAWLACFALACQAFAAFGHVHLAKTSGNLIGFALADSARPGIATDPSSPPQNSPAGPDDFCAICASISMAGTLVVPVPPAIVAPISFVQTLPWSLAATEPDALERVHFDARGPPQA